jgi:hypothetical protein
MIGCDQFLAHLGEYLEGELAAKIRQQLEIHLTECRSCTVLLDSTTKTVKVVTDSGCFALPTSLGEPLLKRIMSEVRAQGLPEPSESDKP